MTHDFDEALRHLPQYELPEETKRRHLELFARVAAAKRKRRRRRRIAIITTCAVVGLGAGGVGTAAALGVFSAEPSDRTVAHCYATTDLTDPSNHTDVVILVGSGTNGSDFGDAAASAMDICSDGWREGRFSNTDPKVIPPQFTAAAHPVPDLVVCVLPSGQVGVFPGDENTCAALGLPVALP